jgi:putative SOS response-associated peptidase YedK
VCGRYSQTLPKEAMRRAFDLHDDIPVRPRVPRPRFNIAPGIEVDVVRLRPDGRRELVPMRWGIIKQTWAPGDPKPINARAENITSGFWRAAFAHRRCALPTDGFYEWMKSTKPRKPWRFTRADGGPLALLGVYVSWQPSQGGLLESVAVITVPANSLLSKLHDRMPAMLDPERLGAWLDPNATEADLLSLLVPYPAEKMRGYPVSPRLNAATFEDPSCAEPWDEEPRLI